MNRLLLCVCCLGLVGVVYSQALGGALFYDDFVNLKNLPSAVTWQGVKDFVFGGTAGPLGRPLSLLSFIPHAGEWPENSAQAIASNITIHLVNAGLLFALSCLLLSRVTSFNKSERFYVSLFSSLLWASLPLLASTSLIVIQRMTGLSAFFGLLGLVGFVYGYKCLSAQPVKALVIQFGCLGAGTVLSILAKESGALIPLYALVIDCLVRFFASGTDKPVNRVERSVARVRLLALLGCLGVILVYISPLNISLFDVSAVRGYTPWDRLQAQVVILWEYLRAAFLPVPSLFGPFHDEHPLTYSVVVKTAALGGWLALVVVGLWLAKAKRNPWLLFAVGWFLTGHLVESTTVMLELYFEHRNYLALYAPVLALVVGVMSLHGAFRPLGVAILGVYWLLQLLVLLAVTSLWGQPEKSAGVWALERPASTRAALHAIFIQSSKTSGLSAEDENYAFLKKQEWYQARQMLDRTASLCPECLGVKLQALLYTCLLQDMESVPDRQQSIQKALSSGKEPVAVVDTLFRLRNVLNDNRCGGFGLVELRNISVSLTINPLFSGVHIKTKLFFIAGMLSEDVGDKPARDRYLARAEAVEPTALPVLQYQVYRAIEEADYPGALQAIERRRPYIESAGGVMKAQILNQLKAEVVASQAHRSAEK